MAASDSTTKSGGLGTDYSLSSWMRSNPPKDPTFKDSDGKIHDYNYRFKLMSQKGVPVVGAEVKFSTIDIGDGKADNKRDKKFGCGFNGANKDRDNWQTTDGNGEVKMNRCTVGIYRMNIKAGSYKRIKSVSNFGLGAIVMMVER